MGFFKLNFYQFSGVEPKHPLKNICCESNQLAQSFLCCNDNRLIHNVTLEFRSKNRNLFCCFFFDRKKTKLIWNLAIRNELEI